MSTLPKQLSSHSLVEYVDIHRPSNQLDRLSVGDGGDNEAANKRQSVTKNVSTRISGFDQMLLGMNLSDGEDDSDDESDNESESDDVFVEETCPWHKPFKSEFEPVEMRCLALVAHNHMKPAMKEFVTSHKELLKKFRLTGTNTTMTMLRELFGDDPSVEYGPGFSSGPLGGDAELCALMCLQDLGGIIFFMDPLSAHPHQADIDSLVRLANVHNIMLCPNPASAHAMCFVLEKALIDGRSDLIPSFFFTLQSPGVKVYKADQARAVAENSGLHDRGMTNKPRARRTEKEAIMESGFLVNK